MIAIAALAIFPAGARASVGVGIQENPVSPLKELKAGGTYSLPAVHVANTGTQAVSIILRVQRIFGSSARKVPPSWIHFSNSRIQLSPHQETKVPLQLAVPETARTGRYQSDVVVIASALTPTKATNFRAAAATKLKFRVLPGPGPGSLSSVPVRTVLALLGVALVVLVVVGNRRYKVRLSVEPRNRDDDSAGTGKGSQRRGPHRNDPHRDGSGNRKELNG